MKNSSSDTPVSKIEKIETVIPEWLQPYVTGIKELQYGGKIYTYCIVNEKISAKYKTPERFTIFKDGLAAISDNYPEEYRETGLIHEIKEYTGPKPEEEMACVDALKGEIETLEERKIDQEKYLRFRLGFFKDLIAYYEGKERTPDEDKLLKKIRHSYEHLEARISELESFNEEEIK